MPTCTTSALSCTHGGVELQRYEGQFREAKKDHVHCANLADSVSTQQLTVALTWARPVLKRPQLCSTYLSGSQVTPSLHEPGARYSKEGKKNLAHLCWTMLRNSVNVGASSADCSISMGTDSPRGCDPSSAVWKWMRPLWELTSNQTCIQSSWEVSMSTWYRIKLSVTAQCAVHTCTLKVSLMRYHVLMLTSQLDWMQVWFEVSSHSGRIHFHTAEDGSQPLGLSVSALCRDREHAMGRTADYT